MSTERIHWPVSPSALGVFEASPCYQGKNEDSAASLAGTKQHKALESGDDSFLTDEEAWAVEQCRSFFEEVKAQFKNPLVLREGDPLPVDDIEVFPGFRGTTAGFVDVAIVSEDKTEAAILDAKFGRWPVPEARENLQGIAYVLGLKYKFPSLKRVSVSFMMPYLEYVDTHTFTEEEFPALYLRVRAVVERVKAWQERYKLALSGKAKFPEFYPTNGSCLFCARLSQWPPCPAVTNVAIKVSKKFLPLEVPENLEFAIVYDKAEMAKIIKLADLMGLFAKAARQAITDESLRQGEPPTGYRFVESSIPSIKDAEYVRNRAAELGVSAEVIKEATSVTLGPLEDAISEAAPRGQKKKSVDAFRSELEEKGAVVQGDPFVSLRMITTKATED